MPTGCLFNEMNTLAYALYALPALRVRTANGPQHDRHVKQLNLLYNRKDFSVCDLGKLEYLLDFLVQFLALETASSSVARGSKLSSYGATSANSPTLPKKLCS